MNSILPITSHGISFLTLLAFFGLAIFPVGHALLRTARFRTDSRLEIVSISLLTGLFAINLFYFLLRRFHGDNLFLPSLMAAVLLSWFSFWRCTDCALKKGLFQPVSGQIKLVFVFLALYFAASFSISGFNSVLWTKDHALILTKGAYSDLLWKVSVISELEHSVPPEWPIFAGHPLIYHYFTELFIVLAHEVTRIDILTLRFWLFPGAMCLMAILLILCGARRIFQTQSQVLLGILFLLLSPPALSFLSETHEWLALGVFFCETC